MNNRRTLISIVVILVGLLLVGMAGCKGKSETETEPNATAKGGGGTPATVTAIAAIAQTTCPIMGGPIDKAVSSEYKGKKVYFCCKGCINKFNAKPEKYTAKLPQFKN